MINRQVQEEIRFYETQAEEVCQILYQCNSFVWNGFLATLIIMYLFMYMSFLCTSSLEKIGKLGLELLSAILLSFFYFAAA